KSALAIAGATEPAIAGATGRSASAPKRTCSDLPGSARWWGCGLAEPGDAGQVLHRGAIVGSLGNQLCQQMHGPSAYSPALRRDGGQRRPEHSFLDRVVESRDRKILGYAQPALTESRDQPPREQVIECHDGCGFTVTHCLCGLPA